MRFESTRQRFTARGPWWLAALLAVACGGDPAVAGQEGDTQAATDTAPGVDSQVADVPPPSAIGKPCASNTACAADGLTCFETNAATGAGICSKPCTGAADCPAGSHCNPQGKLAICTPGRYCNPCLTAADCGPEAPVCLQGKDGKGFCTVNCAVGDGKCQPASSCVAYGSGVKDFACQPDYGACTGGGEHCSPCTTQADCSAGTQCFAAATTGERFCAQTCDPGAAASCPTGFACTAQKTGGALCFKTTAEGNVPTCAKGDKGYCDACSKGYECASGRCATKNGKKFCAQPDPCTKATEQADCPYGGEATFCIGSDVGMICAPPPSWHCQGFKACLGHACLANETCDNGICKPK